MAVKQRKDGRWACYYRDRNNKPAKGRAKVKWEYFGRGPDAEASAWRRNAELGLGSKPGEPVKKTFGEIALAYSNQKPFSPNSRKQLGIRLNVNILPFFGDKKAVHITEQDLDDYVTKRRSDIVTDNKGRPLRVGVKYSTIARELTDVKAIMSYAANRKPPLIEHNPIRDYKKPDTDDEIIRPPSKAEIKSIIKNSSKHLIRAIKLSYFLGLRPGAVELLTLTWEGNVDLDGRTILVISAKKGGADRRLVPIHEDLLEDLRIWQKEDKGSGPLIHYHGKPIKKIDTAWRGALKKAGIKRRIRPYDIRHRFVTTALEEGVDIKPLAEIVGSRPETLMRYYQHVSRRVHRQTISKIPSLDD